MLNHILVQMTSSYRPLRLACVLASATLVTACFYGGGEDNPYTVPAGEKIESVQLEIEPDGTPILLARVAMAYRHQKPVYEWDTVPQTRNLQSIAFRRMTGGWSATSFKNLQENTSSLPFLLRVPGRGYQALVDDRQGIRRYAWQDGAWLRKPLDLSPPSYRFQSEFGYGNFRSLSSLAMADDSTEVSISQNYHYDELQIEVLETRRPKIRLPSRIRVQVLHAEPGFRAFFGYEQLNEVDSRGYTMSSQSRPVYLHWSPGDTAVQRVNLDTSDGLSQARFGDYQGKTALYVTRRSGLRILSLGGTGKPESEVTIRFVEDGFPSQFHDIVIDSTDCIHGLETESDSAFAIRRFLYHNDCSPDPADTLALPAASSGGFLSAFSTQLRVTAGGKAMAAFILREGVQGRNGSYTLFRSGLYFAEKRNGRWVVELVQER